MIYVRETYRVRSGQAPALRAYLDEYLLPLRLKHGARLAGRFVTRAGDEILLLWEYESDAAYAAAEAAARADPLHAAAEARLQQLGPLWLERREDWLKPVGESSNSRHTVAVSGFITDGQGGTVLVRTDWRADTWEMPGGQVEAGEPLHLALKREVLEETGMEVALEGVINVYQNVSRGIVTVFFRGRATGGQLRTSNETTDVAFHRVSPADLPHLVTRPHLQSRLLDAMRQSAVPYEAYRVRPYGLMERLPDGKPVGSDGPSGEGSPNRSNHNLPGR